MLDFLFPYKQANKLYKYKAPLCQYKCLQLVVLLIYLFQ